MHVVVIGGGFAGLGAGLALARGGARVTLLERDATPFPENPVAAFEKWDRRGAPQVRHSHAFLARLRNLLRDRMPDVLEALLAVGTEELPVGGLLREGIDDRSPRACDDDLTLLACRRVTFEWVLHRCVLDTPAITHRDGCEVRGLVGENGVVTGVRIARRGEPDEALAADLVVDAGGRRSQLASWLTAAGFPALRQDSEPCGIFYCSRFYRLRAGVEPPARDTTIGADLGYAKYAIFHGDGGIFSITFAAAPEDTPLRALLRTAPFEAAARVLPPIERWVRAELSEPISEVHGMDGLRNTRRHFLVDGEPIAPGVVAIGDAAIHTNPLYGRGCTLALVHAFLLADALAQHGSDVRALALALEAGSEREIAPWYYAALAQDRDAAKWAQELRAGAPPLSDASGRVNPRAYLRDLLVHGLIPALRLDATVLRAFMRGFNLLDPPGDLMKRPELLQRVLAIYQTRHQRSEPVLGPSRDEMIRVLAGATE